MSSVSFIIATVGRASLERTIESIEPRPGDEILIVADESLNLHLRPLVHRNYLRFLHCPPGHDWGHHERTFATPLAKGDFLSFMDDDDYYASGHRSAMDEAIAANPDGPTIFCMRLHHMGGYVLWRDKELRCGNVGTPMLLIPRDLDKIAPWPPHYGGDSTFIQSCKWKPEQFRWSRQVIAEVTGNSIGQ
jgi:hypothetical protein